VQAVIDSL